MKSESFWVDAYPLSVFRPLDLIQREGRTSKSSITAEAEHKTTQIKMYTGRRQRTLNRLLKNIKMNISTVWQITQEMQQEKQQKIAI